MPLLKKRPASSSVVATSAQLEREFDQLMFDASEEYIDMVEFNSNFGPRVSLEAYKRKLELNGWKQLGALHPSLEG